MNYTISLRTIGIVVGLWLIASHGFALFRGGEVREWLRQLPRSKKVGIGLLTVDAIWAFAMVAWMDLGEFSNLRTSLLILIPVAYYLTLTYVDDFLAARALGILALLVGAPMLDAAFLRPETSRLLVVVLAYVGIVFGLFWIGMPYLLRDQIAWLLQSMTRWRAAVLAGIVYGIALLVCAVTIY